MEKITKVSSSFTTVIFGEDPIIIGERINPTGKETMKKALLEGNYEEIIVMAKEQEAAGVDILDINVGMAGIDEKEVMINVIREIQAQVKIPLQIDSQNPEVIEAALRIYKGKPMINSVTGDDSSMKSLFPLAKQYGACVIGLTLTKKGVPKTVEERLEIARLIVNMGEEYGVPKENILIDPLVLTVAKSQNYLMETLKAAEIIKSELGINIILGISNVSFGFPKRHLLNRTFLAMALAKGVNGVIINPMDEGIMETIDAFRVLKNIDKESIEFLGKYK